MNQQQTVKKVAPGASDGEQQGGLKRLAPESTGLLKELQKAKQEQSQSSKKRQILERCGCL